MRAVLMALQHFSEQGSFKTKIIIIKNGGEVEGNKKTGQKAKPNSEAAERSDSKFCISFI